MQYYIPFEQAKSILNVQLGSMSGSDLIDNRTNQPITTLDQLNDFATYKNIIVPGLTNPNYAFTVGGNWYIADVSTKKIYQTSTQPTSIPVLPYSNGVAISMSGYGFDSTRASETPDQILSTLRPTQTQTPAPEPTPAQSPILPAEPVVTPTTPEPTIPSTTTPTVETSPVQAPVVTPPPVESPLVPPTQTQEPVVQTPPPQETVTPPPVEQPVVQPTVTPPAPTETPAPAPATPTASAVLPTTASGPYPSIIENLWYNPTTRPLLASVLGANPNNSSMGALWVALGDYGNKVGFPELASGSSKLIPVQDKVLESLNYNLQNGTLGQNVVALPQPAQTTQTTTTTPPPTETPPATTVQTPPPTETTTPPATTTTTPLTPPVQTPAPQQYTAPEGAKYVVFPNNGSIFSEAKLYQDGTLVKPDGTLLTTDASGAPIDANYKAQYLVPLYTSVQQNLSSSGGNYNGWGIGNAVTPQTTTPTTQAPSNPLIPANQTPSQISANPLNLDSILSASQGNLNWNLSNWNSQGSSFTQQPVLTVNGQNYTFNTPGEYINALSQIKNTGATGNLDQFISQFQAVTQYFPPTTTVGTVNTYNPQSYVPAPANNSTNTGTNYNTNVDPNGTIAYNDTSTNTMNSIQPPSVQLQIGDTGDAVKQLQDFLVSKGFMTQAQVNTGYGNFGSQTQSAVSAFQQTYGVDTSAGGVGRYGPMTMAKAQSLVTTSTPTTTQPTSTNTNTYTPPTTTTTPTQNTQTNTTPVTTTPTTTTPATTTSSYNFPTTSLSPGQSGADVQKLQNFLVQTGYMTQEQVNTGYGYYGTQTTNAVKQLQEDLGVDNSTGIGYWGPRTLTAVQTATTNIQNTNNNTTTPTNTNTGTTPTNTTPTTPIGSTTGNTTSTGITLQQFNSAMQDPVFTSWYANADNKAQFDALSFDQKSFLLLHTSSLSNTIQNGQVVNPNIQVTPAQLAMFYDQAKSELEPYYTDTYRTLANDVSQSLTRLKEDFDKSLSRAVDPFKSALEKQAEDEAQSGTAFSSGRNKRENTMVTEQNNAISDVFQSAERSAQDLLRGYESKVGTSKASSLATPNLSLYNATNRGMTQSGSRTLNPALIGGVTYGSIGAEQTVSTKKRASEIEQVFRTDRALNNLTI